MACKGFFCEEFGITLNWIYLESGHGKGIADGIGATVKNAIKNLMLMKPSVPMYSGSDLLENGLEEAVPSISIYTYQEENIIKFCHDIPKLNTMKATLKLHEINFILDKGVVTIKIKDKSGDAIAQEASLELVRFKSGTKEAGIDHSESSDDEASEECILFCSLVCCSGTL